jgi:putative ABC transport system permease protein
MRGESLRHALHSLRAQQVRTLLTLLGIMLASGSLVLLVALMRGGEAALQRAAQDATESDLVEVRRADPPPEQRRRTTRPLSRLDADELAATPALTETWVGSEHRHDGVADFSNRHQNVTVVNASPEALALYRLNLERGRFLLPLDSEQARRVCVIGHGVWRDLLQRAPLDGQSLRIDGQPWVVVGVLADKPSLGGDIGTNGWNQKVLVPETSFDASYNPAREATRLFVRARAADAVLEPLRAATLGGLLRRHLGVKNFDLRDPEGGKQQRLVLRIAELLLLSTALVSLLVGGINVMNVMLVTVTERRREIGIRRAVGASPAAIRRQFLTEAALLTGAGGMVGVLCGMGLAIASTWILRALLGHWTLFLEPWAMIVGVLASVLTGLAFGLYPAARAASMNVVEALRSE